MSGPDFTEESYLATSSDKMREYEASVDALRDLENRVQNDLQKGIKEIEILVSSAKHIMGGDIKKDVSEKIDQVIKVIKEIVDGLGKLDIENPEAVKDFSKKSKEKIGNALQTIDALKRRLKDPLNTHISKRYAEYLGLNDEEVLKLLEGLDSNEIQKIKSDIESFIALVGQQSSKYVEYFKEIFARFGESGNLNTTYLKCLPDCASHVYNLLAKNKTGSDAERRVELIVNLLSRINYYNAFSEIGSYQEDIVSLINEMSKSLEELSKHYSVGAEDLYRALYDLISGDAFPDIKSIKEKLEQMVDETKRLVSAKESQQSLKGTIDNVQASNKGIVEGQGSYFKKDYEDFLKTLKELHECYDKGIPTDKESIAKCIYNGGCVKGCEDLTTTVNAKLKDLLKRLLDILGSSKAIAQELCGKARDVIDNIDKLYAEVNGNYSSISTELQGYFEYLKKADHAVKGVIECVMTGGTGQGQEIDVTNLDVKIIESLIEVLRARNNRVILKVG